MNSITLADTLSFDILKEHLPDELRIKTITATVGQGFDLNLTYHTADAARKEQRRVEREIRSIVQLEEYTLLQTLGLTIDENDAIANQLDTLAKQREAWTQHKKTHPHIAELEREVIRLVSENNIKWGKCISDANRAEACAHFLKELRKKFVDRKHVLGMPPSTCPGCTRITL